MRTLLSVLITLLLTSCASTIQYARFTNNEPLANNNARIYVLRPSSFASAIKMKVYEDDTLIGQTGPKGFLCWDIEEGVHQIKTVAENTKKVDLNCQSGHTYYYKQSPKMGIGKARVSLLLIDEAEGKEILKKTKKPKIKDIK